MHGASPHAISQLSDGKWSGEELGRRNFELKLI